MGLNLITKMEDLKGERIVAITQIEHGDSDCPEYVLRLSFESGKIAFIQGVDPYVSLGVVEEIKYYMVGGKG